MLKDGKLFLKLLKKAAYQRVGLKKWPKKESWKELKSAFGMAEALEKLTLSDRRIRLGRPDHSTPIIADGSRDERGRLWH
jgi:hypothetical protein